MAFPQVRMPTDDLDIESQAIDRRRQMAQALMGSQMPQGRMVGNVYVAANPLEYLAAGLKQYAGRKDMEMADADQRALGQQVQQRNAGEVQGIIQALRGTPAQFKDGESMGSIDPSLEGFGPVPEQTAAAVPADPQRAMAMALASRNPAMQQLGASLLKSEMVPENVVVGRSLVNKKTGQVVGTDSTWQQEQQAAREARQAEIDARLNDARTSREERAALQRELAQMRIDAQKQMAQLAAGLRQPQAPVAVEGPDGKPVFVAPADAVGKRPAAKPNENKLPTSALKLQQEELEAINTAGGIVADVTALKGQIDKGDLKLGPLENLTSRTRNMLGTSTENSRNFAAFRTSMEKLRNDSLRLNKGVQTEGDAQRAWNELFDSINDAKVVSRQLGKINEINNRAIGLRRMNIDTIRANYGLDPMDTTGAAVQSPAVGAGGAPANNADPLGIRR